MPCLDFRFIEFVLRYSIVDRRIEKVHGRIGEALLVPLSDACFYVMRCAPISPGVIRFSVVALVMPVDTLWKEE